MRQRFRDPTTAYALYALSEHPIDVVCPRCAAHARVVPQPDEQPSSSTAPRRLVCRECGHLRSWSPKTESSCWGGPKDPFFGQPLWLTTTVRGHRLWAYNREHLTLLTHFVAATLRQRRTEGGCSMSMIETLPIWMKAAHNRPTLLAALTRLEATLSLPTPAPSRP